MSALTWLNGEAFTAFGQHIMWSDMIGNTIGLVEFWFAWLLVDLVGVPLAFSSDLAFSGLVYVIYFALVMWGMRDWWLRTRTPALEGAPA